MSKVNEINEKLIKVLEEKIQLLEEQKTISENIIKIQKEQLFLCGVSQQRELLFDFLTITSPSMSIDDKHAITNSYARIKSNNCG